MTHLEKLAKDYEVENFFDYIIESQANGNFSQVRELAKELKRKELMEFALYATIEGGVYGYEAIRALAES